MCHVTSNNHVIGQTSGVGLQNPRQNREIQILTPRPPSGGMLTLAILSSKV